MKTKLFFILSFSVCSVFSQRKPEYDTQKQDKADVKKAIMNFFEGFHSGDTSTIKQTIHKDLILQTVFKDEKGNDKLHQEEAGKFLNAIATRPSTERWDERLLLFNIQVDGNMANVWTPYEFWYNEKFSHCGVNSFQLMNENGTWKIFYLVDTRRKEGCLD